MAVERVEMHVPVLRDRVVALLAPALSEPGAVVVDATLGLGGHSAALLERFPDLRILALDRDPEALTRAAERLAPYAERLTLVHGVYDTIADQLVAAGMDRASGVLFDLGVSSIQLDEVTRGFSYAQPAPLDMRMDPTTGPTAADVCNTYGVEDLARVLRDYGEERYARRIAKGIVRARAAQPFDSTEQLVDIVRSAIPAAARRTGGHPAKRTFQALRIEVNGELDALTRALPAALDSLRVGGRIVVLAYQSLEDRIVKRTFVSLARPTAPPELPPVAGLTPRTAVTAHHPRRGACVG